MSKGANSCRNSFSNMLFNNNNNNSESKKAEELVNNRYRTYNVKDIKVAKTYLPEAVLRDFKKGFEDSSKSPSTSKSRNFVRKLVANLENRKYRGSGHCMADDEFFSKRYSRPVPEDHKSHQIPEKKTSRVREKNSANIKNLKENNAIKKRKDFKVSMREALQNLTIDEYIKLNSTNNVHQTKTDNKFDNKKNFYSCKDVEEDKKESYLNDFEEVTFRPNLSYSNNEIDIQFRSKSDNPSNIFSGSKNKKSIFRRSSGPSEERKSFKEVLGSLIGFKSRNPALPKGQRNGLFSPKDSLGEEMRIFRRDLMPVLLKSAKPYKTEFEDISKDDTFESIIASSKPPCDNRSATIHPFYGGKKGVPKFLQTLEEENLESQNGLSEAKSQFQPEERKSVVLKEKSFPLYQRPPEIIYDVPKSKKVVNLPKHWQKDENYNTYQNVDIYDESSWRKVANPIPRKNIVCGKRALFIRKQKQGEQ